MTTTTLAAANPVIASSVAFRDMRRADLERHYAAVPWTTPRFYQSPTVLAGGGSQYRAAFVEGCLAILKWKQFYSQLVAYAFLPPMSPTGDAADERRALAELRARGFGVMLTAEDGRRLDVPASDLEPVPWNTEYIYRASHLARLEGGDWAKLRTYRNRAHRDGYRCEDSPAASTGNEDILRLTKDWVAYRRKGGAMTGYIRALGWWPATRVFRMYDRDGGLAAFSYTEDLGPAGTVITGRLRDYARTLIHDPMQLIAHHEALWELENRGDRLMNLGAADPVGGPGLRYHKIALNPVSTQQIYRLAATGDPGAEPGAGEEQMALW